ncbi:tetratricopeptide repeat protein [Cystobacter ferrugineus]|uniref:Gliding motility protein n=1 Tax=Cystobacter ferrugineus TaxID=83449 RepID=A0A1L9B9Y6_9BACT|nr:tetratricopeptide repeat protein [Cystobacter ferrugineus]OJH39038.1 gliding motility protein [Cystobacter ferrugineus]
MHPLHSMGRTLLSLGRGLAVTTLAFTAACATTSTVKSTPVAAAPEAPVPVQVEAPPAPPPAPADSPAAKARERFAEAVAAFDAGDYARAEEGFQEVLHRAPQSLNAQFNLGVIAERQGRLAEAQAAYEKVRFLDQGHVPTLLNLGRLYRMQGKFADAIALYEAGLKTPGRDMEPSLLNNLSVAYRLAGKLPQAEASARRVLSRHPDDAEAYKNLALVYYEQGRYRLAETVLVNARKLAEKDPGIPNNLGMVYLKLEDRPRALAQFQKAVSLDERFAPGYVNLGALALAWRDYAGAERAFTKAVELEPESHEAWLSYAYALDGQKGRDAKKGLLAGEAFEKVLALRADSPEALCGAGWAYAVDRAGWDKAEGFLQRCQAAATTSAQDKQMIAAKLQGIAAMRKSSAPAAPAEDGSSSPSAVGGSGALQGGSPGEQAAPEGTPAQDAAPAAQTEGSESPAEAPKAE